VPSQAIWMQATPGGAHMLQLALQQYCPVGHSTFPQVTPVAPPALELPPVLMTLDAPPLEPCPAMSPAHATLTNVATNKYAIEIREFMTSPPGF